MCRAQGLKGRIILLSNDEAYMRTALSLADMGKGQTSPNPIVGAVLVRDHCIVGFGAHLQAGKPHAEVHALQMAGEQAQGSTLYVTLEPCAHYGKTPPCADAVIRSGVKRVVVAMEDPFSQVSGRGIARMREAGLQVDVGCLAQEAEHQNEAFLHFARTGFPFVTLKLAATLDGMIATQTGDSKYVTGTDARALVHHLRDQVDAIVVGVKTVIADNPQLTVRLPEGGKHPVRVILDTHLVTPTDSQVFSPDVLTILFCSDEASVQAEQMLTQKGALVIRKKATDGKLDIVAVMRHLASLGYLHVLVEGGASVAGSCLQQRVVNEVWMFHAPKLLGIGRSAIDFSLPVGKMQEAILLKDVTHKAIGGDWLTIGTPFYPDESL